MSIYNVKWLLGLTIGSIFLITGLAIFLPPWVRENWVYVGASIDKEYRLNTQPGQRIVLVGGSSCALGINSRTLETYCHRPVINMGLHANLGLPFMLAETQAGIHPGDLVVLGLEYELNSGDKRLLSQLTDINPQATHYLDFSIADRIRFFVQNLQRCLFAGFYKLIGNPQKMDAYNRYAFNQEGDYIAHYGLPPRKELSDKVKAKPFDPTDNINRINLFISCARQKGASVVLTFPPYCESAYQFNKGVIKNIETQYRAKMKCPILGKPELFILPDSLFFDTVYHLTKHGGEIRTHKMNLLLTPYLNNQNRFVSVQKKRY